MAETNKISKIFDAKYQKIDLVKVVESKTHLVLDEKKISEKLLHRHESLFNSTIGTWKLDKYHVTLTDGTKLYRSRLYQIPKAYKH